MATSGVISLHLRSRNPKSHYTRCSGRNPTQKNAPPFPLHVGTPTGGGQNFASTLGPHVWSSRRPTLPRTEIPPRQPPNARKKKSEHRERHRHPHDTAAVSSKSRFWGLQNLRKSRKRSEGSLRHCSCVKQRRCQLRPQQMPHRQ